MIAVKSCDRYIEEVQVRQISCDKLTKRFYSLKLKQ